jgi:hypothetical protein
LRLRLSAEVCHLEPIIDGSNSALTYSSNGYEGGYGKVQVAFLDGSEEGVEEEHPVYLQVYVLQPIQDY